MGMLREETGGLVKAKDAKDRLLVAVVLLAAIATAGMDALGITATVQNKAQLLDAIAEASDGRGRLNQDLVVTFAADCAPMVVGETDLWNASEKCLLDCGGHKIRLDARSCPSSRRERRLPSPRRRRK